MPYKPLHNCKHTGCHSLASGPYCDEHRKQKNIEYNIHRPRRSAIYQTPTWRKARERYLHQYPLCVECLKHKILKPATEVDHIIPHDGDMGLFWDEGNWQALCKPCHSRKTMKEANLRRYGGKE